MGIRIGEGGRWPEEGGGWWWWWWRRKEEEGGKEGRLLPSCLYQTFSCIFLLWACPPKCNVSSCLLFLIPSPCHAKPTVSFSSSSPSGRHVFACTCDSYMLHTALCKHLGWNKQTLCDILYVTGYGSSLSYCISCRLNRGVHGMLCILY